MCGNSAGGIPTKTGSAYSAVGSSATLDDFPTGKHAQRAVDAVRLEVNSELPRAVPITVATLVDRYVHDSVEMERLAFATKLSYTSFLKNWIRPKWGTHRLEAGSHDGG